MTRLPVKRFLMAIFRSNSSINFSELKNSLHIRSDKQKIYQGAAKDGVIDVVHTQGPIIFRCKNVPAVLLPLRTLDLDIDKSATEIPYIYSALPAHRNTPKPDPIVDQRTFHHDYRAFRKNLKLPARVIISRLRASPKRKDLRRGSGKPNFRMI